MLLIAPVAVASWRYFVIACLIDCRLLNVADRQMSHTFSSVTKQYNLAPLNVRWCLAADIGLTSHWPRVTDISLHLRAQGPKVWDEHPTPYALLWSTVDVSLPYCNQLCYKNFDWRSTVLDVPYWVNISSVLCSDRCSTSECPAACTARITFVPGKVDFVQDFIL